jgi:NitT/TauT family transport system substrate-binding protein
LTACATPAATPLPKTGTLRVGFSTEADVGDVPSLMAQDRLRAEGYTVETNFFSAADVQVAALTQGSVDIGNGSTRTAWNAVGKGAEIATIAEQAADAWSIVAVNEIKTCADLNGKRVGLTSSSSLNAALLKAYLKNCPGTEPQILTIANSSARAAALLAGELDATPLELADSAELAEKAPTRFHTLVNFATELPQLKTTGVHVSRAFAQQHPELVRAYLKALLQVHRDIRSNPQVLSEAIARYLNMDAAAAKRLGEAYLARNIFDVNGGVTRDGIAYSVDFFTQTGSLPEGLNADKVSDLSYLEQVLQEIGRK